LLQLAPENTLAAFRGCLALRVGFEFDVRRTKDSQLVCLHDDTLDRTTTGTGRLAERTLDEVRQLDAGSWFDDSFRGERAPTVEEVLALLAQQATDSTLVAVDLKETGSGIEETLVRSAVKHKVLDRLVFIGAAIESAGVRERLQAASARCHSARLAVDLDQVPDAIRDDATDWVYVRFLPPREALERIHEAGKRIFLAGPLVAGNQRDHWAKAMELGIDAILTDYPLELRQQIRQGRANSLR
jgi:glycerophosphoryl diester phosphodiesterase